MCKNGGREKAWGFLPCDTLLVTIFIIVTTQVYSLFIYMFATNVSKRISILCANETIVPTMKVAIIQYEAIAAYFSLGDFVNHNLATFYT